MEIWLNEVCDIMLTHLSLLLPSRVLLKGKSVGNLIQGIWASVYEVYVAVVTATTLLLKLDAQVHDQVSRGTSLGGRALLSSQLFWLLGCKLPLIFFKHLYDMTALDYFEPFINKPDLYQDFDFLKDWTAFV